MSVLAVGTSQYQLGKLPVTALGVLWSGEQLQEAMAGPVLEALSDKVGMGILQSLLAEVDDTEFQKSDLERVLGKGLARVEEWRVGEAIAEHYLSQHRYCHFPWPDEWDQRKMGSSLPGADLVGFQKFKGTYRFAFGEVKTSSDKNCPPGTMYGRTGLKQQIEDLRDELEIRRQLVRYLGYRAEGASWKLQYREATTRYLRDEQNVSVFGVLIRDVTPNQDDLAHRQAKLAAASVSSVMTIELLAIYIPEESIDQFNDMLKRYRKEGSE